MSRRRMSLYFGAIGLLAVLVAYWYIGAFSRASTGSGFDGERAFKDVQTQVAMGPRIPTTPAHAQAVAWIENELRSAGWQVSVQSAEAMGHPILNIVADRSPEAPTILLGAHYDSRIYASRDPDPAKVHEPVPGADDGGSGVAVLLELARTLPQDTVPIRLVFFDAEDNGEIPGWDWLLGSRAYVAAMTAKPKMMVLVDMVGDQDLKLPMEANSDPAMRTSIWQEAAKLGYAEVFIPQVKYSIEDDHLPFIEAGIPSVDIIDLDYAYWHTTSDTPEHVSAKSLQMVGDVLWNWIVESKPGTKPVP
jgi:glutaminyl-peptide cyclotransferase